MGVEVVESEVAHVPVEVSNEGDNGGLNEKENGKLNVGQGITEPIKFGSHGTDEPAKVEVNNKVTESNFPKDAADEWPAPKQIHSFYFPRYRPFDDPKLKVKLDLVEKDIQKKNQARYQLTEGLRAKRSERAQVIAQLKALSVEDKQFRMIVDEKRREMEPLTEALGKLRTSNNRGEKGVTLCSSEEELNAIIRSFHYRMQHESIPLSEEKQLLREIKQLEGTRERVIANAAMRAKIQDSLGQKEAIQDQVKLIGGDLDGVKKDKQVVRAKIKTLEDELKAVDKDIASLQDQLTALTQSRDKAYEGLQDLRKNRDDGNSCFYQNRSLLNNARELAAQKDIRALEELSNTEVEKFMSLWSSTKAFRDDYEKRILPSLDSRQLSRDGRMRNPNEKPLVEPPPDHSESETVFRTNLKKAKEDVKRPKEEVKPVQENHVGQAQKTQKEANAKPAKGSAKAVDEVADEKISVPEKKETPVVNVVDEAKLKELKREEEIAKAKMALERKKKLAEKAAAKASIRAQKDAEKKLKEREKKAKKKAAASLPGENSEEQSEAAAEAESVAEPEEASVTVDTPPPLSKTRDQKESSLRYRTRTRGPTSIPKVSLKRKKATNYWVYAAPAAAALVVVVLALGYTYLL